MRLRFVNHKNEFFIKVVAKLAKNTEKYKKSNSKQLKNGKKRDSIAGSYKSPAASKSVNKNSMSKSDELTLRAWKKTFENHKKAA